MANGRKDGYGLHKDISSIFDGVSTPKQSCSSRPMRKRQTTADRPKKVNPVVGSEAGGAAVNTSAKAKSPRPKVKPISQTPSGKGPKVVEISRGGTIARIKKKLLKPKPGVSPARQKTMVVMIPLLAIVFIYVVMQVFGTSPRSTKARDRDDETTASKSSNEIEWELPQPYPADMRDPMVAAKVEEMKPVEITMVETRETNPGGRFEIKGIVYSESNPSAMIGSRIVREGDSIDGAEVVEINENSVVFEANGTVWTEEVRR